MKGGVGKSITTINLGAILAEHHGKKVLVIDNDKQGNMTKFFDAHSYENPSISEVLTIKNYDIREAIVSTRYPNLDLLPANMSLLKANREILMDASRPQQSRLAKALDIVRDDYDYCIIDNAPDINMSVINALVATNDVIVPITADKFAFDGLDIIVDQIEEIKDFNSGIELKGCFITKYETNNVNTQSFEQLKQNSNYKVFDTVIRKTTKVSETTFNGKALIEYSRSCTASKDYFTFVREYFKL
jgi:chromosome partitioning protein